MAKLLEQEIQNSQQVQEELLHGEDVLVGVDYHFVEVQEEVPN